MVDAPPSEGYAVVCQQRVIPDAGLEDAAQHLADAYRRRCECRVMACPTAHRHRDLHGWERARLVELAASLLAPPA